MSYGYETTCICCGRSEVVCLREQLAHVERLTAVADAARAHIAAMDEFHLHVDGCSAGCTFSGIPFGRYDEGKRLGEARAAAFYPVRDALLSLDAYRRTGEPQ